MVKTSDLILIGGTSLGAMFFLGMLGKPEDITKSVSGVPDFSFLADIFSGGIGVPDLGGSFFEGIAQQLAALQDQMGETASTIINLPGGIIDDAKDALSGLGEDALGLGEDVGGIPANFLEGFFRGFGEVPGIEGGFALPEVGFNLPAGLFSGVIGTLLGIPLGPGAIITGLGSFVAGGFGAVPLSEHIKIVGLPPLPVGPDSGVRGLSEMVVSRIVDVDKLVGNVPVSSGRGFSGPSFTPKSPAAKQPVEIGFRSFESFVRESSVGDLGISAGSGSFRYRG